MIRIHINLDRRNTSAYLLRIQEKITSGLMRVSKEYAYKVRDETRRMMDEPKSGIQYPRLPRRSSAPGEAPASQSGRLQRSIRIWSNGSGWFTVGTPLWYGRFLMSKRNRPALQPALEKIEPLYVKAIREMIERSIR